MPKVYVVFQTEDDSAPIPDAWIYLKQGTSITLLRTSAATSAPPGLALAQAFGKTDATRSWEYTTRFTIDVPVTVELLYSRGARPLPAAVLARATASFVTRKLEPPAAPSLVPDPYLCAPNELNTIVCVPGITVLLPRMNVAVTTPAELTFWPLLWEQASAAFYTDGMGGGATIGAREHTRAPATTRGPKERGLRIAGSIDARATGAKLAVWSVRDAKLIKLRASATDTATAGHDDVPLRLGARPAGTVAAASAPRAFEQAVYFLTPEDALGPVQILVTSEGIAPVQTIGAFTAHLCGVQGALVDDTLANIDGTRAGPQPSDQDEVHICDFNGHSPIGGPDLATANGALRRQARVRRMVKAPIRCSRERNLASMITPVRIVHPEMPMWMAELHLAGVKKAELEDLLIRRKKLLPGAPTQLTLSYRWELRFQWKGPDNSIASTPWYSGPNGTRKAAGYDHFEYDERHSLFWGTTGAVAAGQTVTLRLDATEKLDLEPSGLPRSPFTLAPGTVPFPVAGRRTPVVQIDGQKRRWGRLHTAKDLDTLLFEWQVVVLRADQRTEAMRGGDCDAHVAAVQIDGVRVDSGYLPDGSRPPATLADVAVPTVRVLGDNPATVPIYEAAVNAITDRFYSVEHAGDPVLSGIPLVGWQAAVRTICSHESRRRQFWDSPTSARWLGENFQWSEGNEMGMTFFGGPRGYGIGQKDPHPELDAMFDYLEAIRTACQELMVEKVNTVVNRLLSPHLDLTRVNHRAAVLRAAVRAYNGGTEFRWVPRHGATGPTDGTFWVHPVTARAHIEYPNEALDNRPHGGRNVNYAGPDVEWTQDYYYRPAFPPAPAAPAAPPGGPGRGGPGGPPGGGPGGPGGPPGGGPGGGH